MNTIRVAIRAELDAALPPHDLHAPDAAETVRAYREADTAATDAHIDRAASSTTEDSDENPGQVLLRTLGLAS